jgi:hypothetical protein
MYDEVACLQQEADQLQLDDPSLFTNIPIDPEILRLEHEFCIQQKGGLSQVLVSSKEEDNTSLYYSDDISPPRSVATIDSIQENADFVHVE